MIAATAQRPRERGAARVSARERDTGATRAGHRYRSRQP